MTLGLRFFPFFSSLLRAGYDKVTAGTEQNQGNVTAKNSVFVLFRPFGALASVLVIPAGARCP